MRYLTLCLLTLFLAGCGSDFSLPPTSPAELNLAVVGRALLAQNAGEAVARSIDGLGSAKAGQVYTAIAQWTDGQTDLTGTVSQACAGLAAVVNSPLLGADAVYTFLSRLRPDAGQGFATTAGGTLGTADPQAVTRVQDSLKALVAPPINDSLNALVAANLGSNLTSLIEFHGLRILEPAAMPRRKRAGLSSIRLTIPLPVTGTPIQKVIKVADMVKYLNGTYDPTVGGFAAVTDQIQALVTPRQLIDGLRLDYAGGFQNETSVALLLFNQTVNMTYVVPFTPAMGGVFQGSYPFTGTGCTSCTDARTVPEISQPAGTRTRMPAGAQMVEVDPAGTRYLRGVLAADGTWTLVTSRQIPRTPLEQKAYYKGVTINLTSTDGHSYWVGSFGLALPDGFFPEMWQVGHLEYLGKIPVEDPNLRL